VRRILATVILAVVVVLAAAPAASAQSDDQGTTTTAPERGGDIIPEPNSGVEPEDAGDRGGSLQTAIFIGIVGGIVVMGAVLVRQSRKARADRGF
jgi:hypothetical protein